jgi:hypothetical protein
VAREIRYRSVLAIAVLSPLFSTACIRPESVGGILFIGHRRSDFGRIDFLVFDLERTTIGLTMRCSEPGMASRFAIVASGTPGR